MFNFNNNPKLIYDNIKELLSEGVINRKHAFHTPVFSNINNNFVASRIVVLRKFDSDNMSINFHTDYRSPKIKNLNKTTNSKFIFYDTKLKLQLRIKTISKINNQNNITKEAWENTKLISRKCYLTEKSPSSESELPQDGIPLSLVGIEPTKKESEKGYKNFAVIQNSILEIDWLYLNFKGHRRLKIKLENNNASFKWLIP